MTDTGFRVEKRTRCAGTWRLGGCAFSTSESVKTEGVIPRGSRLAVVLLRVIFLPIIFLPIIFLPILGWSWQEDGWQENGVGWQVEWEWSLFWERLAIRELSDVKNAQPLGSRTALNPALFLPRSQL